MLCSVSNTAVKFAKRVDNHFDLCCYGCGSGDSIKDEMYYVNFPVSPIVRFLCQ